VVSVKEGSGTLSITVEKPINFNDLNHGDSVAVDGVCLTVEAFDEKQMAFTLGPETLRITGWTPSGVQKRMVNLERSLRLNDRIHGHLVTGHVDTTARIVAAETEGETLRLSIEIPKALEALIWPKGSLAVNGVSLTINRVSGGSFDVGLIPETLRRTNLGALKAGDLVNLEADNMARGLLHFTRSRA